MYAVIALGGKQYRVSPGETLVVDRLQLDEGATFEPTVLMAGDGDKVVVDAAGLKKVKVSAKVTAHKKGKKIRVLRYEPKSNWTKRRGHRSHQSVIEIAKIAV
jgi:large subunit ribosomal protein L21